MVGDDLNNLDESMRSGGDIHKLELTSTIKRIRKMEDIDKPYAQIYTDSAYEIFIDSEDNIMGKTSDGTCILEKQNLANVSSNEDTSHYILCGVLNNILYVYGQDCQLLKYNLLYNEEDDKRKRFEIIKIERYKANFTFEYNRYVQYVLHKNILWRLPITVTCEATKEIVTTLQHLNILHDNPRWINRAGRIPCNENIIGLSSWNDSLILLTLSLYVNIYEYRIIASKWSKILSLMINDLGDCDLAHSCSKHSFTIKYDTIYMCLTSEKTDLIGLFEYDLVYKRSRGPNCLSLKAGSKTKCYLSGSTSLVIMCESESGIFSLYTYDISRDLLSPSTMQNDISNLYDMELFPGDMEFLIGPTLKSYPAHMAVIAARSKYCETIIRSLINKYEDEQNIIKRSSMPCLDMNDMKIVLPDASYEAFEQILYYVYHDDKKDDWSDLFTSDQNMVPILEILKLSIQFNLFRLSQICRDFLLGILNCDNVVEIYEVCHRWELMYIKEKCLQIIKKKANYQKIVSGDGLKVLNKEQLLEIIKYNYESKSINKHSHDVSAKNLCSTFNYDISRLLSPWGQKFSDVIIFASDQDHKIITDNEVLVLNNEMITIYYAHRIILACRSEYFQSYFRINRASANSNDSTVLINFSNHAPLKRSSTLPDFLEYIYTDHVSIDISKKDALLLYDAHDYYRLSNDRLRHLCKEVLEYVGPDDELYLDKYIFDILRFVIKHKSTLVVRDVIIQMIGYYVSKKIIDIEKLASFDSDTLYNILSYISKNFKIV